MCVRVRRKCVCECVCVRDQVVYMMIIATCLQPFTCQAHIYRGSNHHH